MKKGQMFTWDMLIGTAIFLLALANIIELWQTSYDDLRNAETDYEMNWLAETVSDQLVRTAGDPYDWTADNVNALGLAHATNQGKMVEGRVLDADKILNMITIFQQNYSMGRNRLLGSSQYEVYMELSCVNSTYLKCLQGVPVQNIYANTISCANQDIHVNTYNGASKFTDVYLWLEAEDLWGSHTSTVCQKGCSAGNMSNIGALPGTSNPAQVKTVPGQYWVWARTVDANAKTQLVVDGVPYPLFNKSFPNIVGWAYVGNMTLGSATNLDFKDKAVGTYLDALLFTTDRFYDPRSEHPDTFGNPNIDEPCIIGNKMEGANSISVTKDAIISLPLSTNSIFTGLQPVVDDTFEVNVVVWGGTAMQLLNTTNSTTTTTVRVGSSINCTGSPSYGCGAMNLPVLSIENVTVWGGGAPTDTITCDGTPKTVTIYWRGRHAGDPNYWSFFINNDSYFISSCESNSTASEAGTNVYDYDMNCSINPSNLTVNLPDGSYDLIVTGNDFRGWCYPYPTNTSQDSENRMRISLQQCVNYADLTCTPPVGGVKFSCAAGTPTVSQINRVVAPATISCGTPATVDVYWGGNHGLDDSKVQWTYMLKDTVGYKCVGTCQSTANDGTGTNYYKMSCSFDPATGCNGVASGATNGLQTLYVVAKSDKTGEYCNNPDSNPEAVGYTAVTVSSCP